VEVTDKHQGEQLGYYLLQEGDVVVVDRGYNQAKGLIAQADRGVSVVLRYNPHRLNVYDAAGDPTTEAAAIIQRLGVNISDLSDLPALFQQFHTAGLTAADAIKIFGLEGAGAAQILARLAPDLQTLTGPVSSGYRCAAHNQRVSIRRRQHTRSGSPLI